ncbi:hypothetical protein NEIELOOT_02691 [Neisseria elongata subsp. glycolytica ATCC 29315]|uniref:Uncharacterized protein n=1 Tax=Neisseria elongata subsp. glycolytica ATCC 29315 TaxID=546263 RepID=D4DUD2_NEIEG|nr:hypothetical protein NEIELOOT_02691 [Neisseria elongata subsp. glycolytica ATCC 29315]
MFRWLFYILSNYGIPDNYTLIHIFRRPLATPKKTKGRPFGLSGKPPV